MARGATLNQKSVAERGEDAAAGVTGPPCPFCGSRETTAVTTGWPTEIAAEVRATDWHPEQGPTGTWSCGNCGESGPFDATQLHWVPEGDSTAADQQEGEHRG